MSIMVLLPGVDNSYKEAKRFDCEYCGCAFIADDKEYKQYKNHLGKYVYFMDCPCCKRNINRYEDSTGRCVSE